MPAFTALRRIHQCTQTNDAPPERVFPLLCPVREAEWVPEWKFRLIYSDCGVAEDGCVFTTPNEAGPETVWMVTHYDPANFRIAFAWVEPGRVATQLWIALEPAPGGKTHAHIRYIYTASRPKATPRSSVSIRNGSGRRCRTGKPRSITSSAPGKLRPASAWE